MNQQMLGTIHQVLSKLGIGFNAAHRVIALKLGDTALNDNFYLQFVFGHSALNEGLELELICLSTNASIPLKHFIGQTAVVEQRDQQGQVHVLNGIITQAASGQNDGGFAVYKLIFQDTFSSLMPKRRNSRVFMQKSVLDITQIIFAEWQKNSALFAKTLTLDVSKISKTYDILPFSMQSQESDFDFLTRLWRRASINWMIDSTGTQQALILFDDAKTLAQNPAPILHFHHADNKAQHDSINTLTAQRQLQSSHIHVQRWSQQHGSMDEHANISSVQQSNTYSSASLNLEKAWYVGDGALGGLDGQDQSTPPSTAQLERLGELLIQRSTLETKSFHAIGSVRTVKLGCWFSLAGHHQLDQKPASAREFLITQLSFYAQNNLPNELSAQIIHLVQQSQWVSDAIIAHQTQQPPHQVSMTLIRRDVPIVPFYDPLLHVAKAHPMRARVVTAENETMHVDAWGRIKVRFLFTRPDDHQHSGGAGSSDTDSDSAWVDVLTPWAGDGSNGSNYGVRFLPRAGELVVIDFLDGNADQPVVVGRIHEGSRISAQFDGQGSLPDTRALSGIKTQEINGEGFNQLRFDDTTGQISAQLQSSHAASQLNLGHLSHPKASDASSTRGEGFELRTDQWGAVRAGQGLLVSTHAQDQAKANHLDASDAKSQLNSALNSAAALSDVAKNQHAEPLDILENLKGFIDYLQQDSPEQAAAFKSAIMLLTSPESIGLSSQADIHVSADGQISHSAGDSINLSTQNNLVAHAQQKISLFAAGQGISAVAAKGNIALQAQTDGIEAIARKVIQIISAEDRIEITSPKEITLTAGGSQLLLGGQGVLIQTGGKFEAKAGQHVFSGGQKVQLTPVNLPGADIKNWIELDYRNPETRKGIANNGYKIFFKDGTTLAGKLDTNGFARHENIPPETIKKVVYEIQEGKEKIANPLEELLEIEEDSSTRSNGDLNNGK